MNLRVAAPWEGKNDALQLMTGLQNILPSNDPLAIQLAISFCSNSLYL
jgi:hypothetical protein